MESTGYIEIRISGQKGGVKLTPENFDISEVQEIIFNFERIVFAGAKKHRPIVSYEQEEGSVRSRFKTKAQIVLATASLLTPIRQNPGLEFLELETARGVEGVQRFASERNYTIEITTTASDEKLIIDRSTDYRLASETLVDADFYFYGEVSTIGGKTMPSIKIDTKDFGVLVLKTSRETLRKIEDNLLYTVIGVHAHGKQNIRDYEIDHQSLEFVNFLEYAPQPDRKYLDALIARASNAWEEIEDPDEWLHELRGEERVA